VLDEDTLQPEEAEKQKINSNAVLSKLASCMAQVDTAEDSSERLPLRLVQLQPAWALHLMLRFRGLSYHCENSRLPYSLGHALPLLVDGHYLWEEQDALGHLSHLCGAGGGSGDGQQRGSALDSPPPPPPPRSSATARTPPPRACKRGSGASCVPLCIACGSRAATVGGRC
jgi:hypothetical protein